MPRRLSKSRGATGIDKETGRPIEAPGARYESEPFLTMPTGFGGHNWHPMAYKPAHRACLHSGAGSPCNLYERAGLRVHAQLLEQWHRV